MQSEVHISRSNGSQEHPMQVQGYSSFCGLCVMNNAIEISNHGPPMFDVFDLDLAADNFVKANLWNWLWVFSARKAYEVPGRRLQHFSDGRDSNQEQLCVWTSRCTLKSTSRWSTNLILWSQQSPWILLSLLGLFRADEKPALIARTHFVTQLFKQDSIVLLESQWTSALSMSLRDGHGFIQREASIRCC